jgi:hypothetical protein
MTLSPPANAEMTFSFRRDGNRISFHNRRHGKFSINRKFRVISLRAMGRSVSASAVSTLNSGTEVWDCEARKLPD